MEPSEAERFLRTRQSIIIQSVRNVKGLTDFLSQPGSSEPSILSKEMASNICTEKTSQDQMREVYNHLNSRRAFELTLKWLQDNEPDVIKELGKRHRRSAEALDQTDSDASKPGKRPKTEDDYYSPETFGRVSGRGYRGTASRGGTRGRGYIGTGSRGGMRGRGYRGAATRGGTRGRGYRGAGARGGATGRGAAFKPEDSEEARIIDRDDEVRAEREKFLEKLTLEELRELFRPQLEKQPNLVLDVLKMCQRTNDAPPSEPNPDLPWCKCGNCREMPTDIENLCCDQQPDYCISRLQHFCHFCLDDELLRQDTEVQVAQTADDLKAYRNAAYGRFVTWKYGPLGPGNRVPVPSCCVWRIRDKYPDPHGQYTGFILSPQKDSLDKTCSHYSKKLYFG